MKKRIWKRLLVFILAVTMVAGVFPGTGMSARAEDTIYFDVKDGSATNATLVDFLNGYGLTASTDEWITDTGGTQIILNGSTTIKDNETSNTYANNATYVAQQQTYTRLGFLNYQWVNDSGKLLTFVARIYHDFNITVSVPDGFSGGKVTTTYPSGTSTDYANGSTIYTVYKNHLENGITMSVPTIAFNEDLNLGVVVKYNGVAVPVENGQFTLDTSNVTTSATLSVEYSLPSQEEITITSNRSDYGSVTFKDKTPVSEGVYKEYKGEVLIPVIEVAPGCELFGWQVTQDGKTTFVKAIDKVTVTGAATYKALFHNPTSDPVVAWKKDTPYYYLQSELANAINDASSGDIIVMISNATLPEHAQITMNAGVTLLLPYANGKTSINDDVDGFDYANTTTSDYSLKQGTNIQAPTTAGCVNTTLTVPSTTSITVNSGAQLVVGGMISSVNGTGVAGQTAEAWSNMVLDGNLYLKGGRLSVSGYMLGDGNIYATEGASIYEPLVIGDFSGGTYTAVTAKKKNNPASPFLMYGLINIHPTMSISDSSRIYGYCDFYASSQHNISTALVVSDTDDGLTSFFKYGDNATVSYSEEKKVHNFGIMDITFSGDSSISSLSITVSSFATFNTSDLQFPVPYNFQIKVDSGKLTVPSGIKAGILPGCEVYVDSDAELEIASGGEVVVYDGGGFLSYAGDTQPYHKYPSATTLIGAGLSERGRLIVDGTLTVNGTLAGWVETQNYSGQIKMGSSATTSKTVTDGSDHTDEYTVLIKTFTLSTNNPSTKVQRTLNAQVISKGTNGWICTQLIPGNNYYGTVLETADPDGGFTYTDVEAGQEYTVEYENPILEGRWETGYEVTLQNGNDAAKSLGVITPTTESITFTESVIDNYEFDTVTTNVEGVTVSGVADSGNGTITYTLQPMPQADVLLTSIWKANVTLDSNTTGASFDTETISTTYGEVYGELPVPSKDGYEFLGWYTAASGGTKIESSTVVGTYYATLYAHWDVITYDISYDTDVPEGSALQYTVEDAVSLPILEGEYLKTGYRFLGWLKKDTTGDPFKTISKGTTGDLELIAQYKGIESTMTLYPGEGTISSGATTYTVAYGEPYPEDLPTPTREGYTFTGWYTASTETTPIVPGVTTVAEVKKHGLYAKWEINSHDATFVIGDAKKTVSVEYGSTLTIPSDLSAEIGYHVTGWKVGEDSINLNTYTMPDNAITVTADVAINTFTVVYNVNGGTANDVDQITETFTYADGKGLASASELYFTKEHYTLTAWNTAADGTGTNYSISEYSNTVDTPLSTEHGVTINLYAIWTANPYTISFEENGGTEVADITAGYGSEVSEPNEPTKLGYTFGGWYTDRACTTSVSWPMNMPVNGITLYAKWEINQYTMTFLNDKEGTSVKTITDDYESAIEAPADLTREGYTFLGWYEEVDGTETEATIPTTMPAENKTYYAKWQINQYTMTFLYEEEGTSVKTITEVYNTAIEAPADPTKEGYTFLGWYEDVDGTETKATIPATMPAANKTYYAKWTINSYTLEYKIDGETYTTASVVYGTPITLIEAPAKDGYVFSGWSSAPETMPAENVTITGTFTAKEVLVKFDANYEGAPVIDSQTVTYDSKYGALPTPLRTGYDFVNWYDNSDLSGEPTTALTVVKNAEEHTLYAKWEANTYVLTLDPGLGVLADGVNSTVEVKYDGTYGVLPEPSRTGYTFAGWYLDGTKVESSSKVATAGNHTLTANWTANTNTPYKVEYYYMSLNGTYPDTCKTYKNATGQTDTVITLTAGTEAVETGYTFDETKASLSTGTIAGDGSLVLKVYYARNQHNINLVVDGKTTSIPYYYEAEIAAVEDPEKTGHTFNGWYDNSDYNGSTASFPTTMPASDLTYYAKFTVNTYYIQFETYGGTTVETIEATYGSGIAAPAAPTKEGYVFTGWVKGGEPATIPETMPAENLVYYATWAADTYEVTFDAGEGTLDGEADAKLEVTYDDTYGTLPTASRTGYTFAGWSLGNTKITADTIVATAGDHTLTADWTANTYEVTLDAKEGALADGVNSTVEVKYDGTYGVLPEPSRTGYSFDGWYLDGTKIESGTKVSTAGNHTLVAKWTVNTYEVTFAPGLGTLDDETLTKVVVTYDDTYGALPTASRRGYTFDGWYLNANFSNEAKIETASVVSIASNHVLYAKWTPITYYVAFDNNGGSGSMDTISLTYDTSKNLTANSFTKTGYNFAGWALSADGSFAYADKASALNLTSDAGKTITLYALWQEGLTSYTVEHHFQNVDGTAYVCDVEKTQTLSGTTGDTTTAESYPYEGFTAKEVEQKTIAADGSTVVVIQYDRNVHKAIWVSDNGTADTEVELRYGASIVPPLTPDKTGYKFTGWVYNNGTAYTSADVMLDADVTLTATWAIQSYDVIWKIEGPDGTITSKTETYVYDTDVTTYAPEKTGYTLSAWYKDEGYEYVAAIPEKMPAEDVVYYAKWNANNYVVTFNAGEGSLADGVDASKTVTYDGTYGSLPTPSRTGYSFAGWYLDVNDAESKVTETTTVATAANHTLTAKWDADSYEVTLDAGEGTFAEGVGNSKTVTYGEAYGTLPAPSRTGYDFAGWYLNGQIVEEDSVVTTAGVHTLTAEWTARTDTKYTVEHHLQEVTGDGYTIHTGSTQELKGTTAGETAAVAKNFSGYTAKAVEQKTIAADGSTVVVIQYDRNVHKAIWVSDNGAADTEVELRYGASIVPPLTPDKTGYKFTGWVYNNGTAYTSADVMLDADVTLTATWAIQSYDVIWKIEGPDGTITSKTETYVYDTDVTTYAPEKTGYTLSAWYKDEGYEYVAAIPEKMPAEDVVYYAKWNANNYVVTFNAGEGSLADGVDASKTVTYDGTYGSLPTPSRTGYSFAGWYLDVNDAESKVTETTTVATAANHTLTAKWDADSYEVTLDAGEGTFAEGVGNSKTVTYGEAYGTLPAPSRTGYDFAGWYLNGQSVDKDTVVETAQAHTLVAKWTARTDTKYTVEHYIQNIDNDEYTLDKTVEAEGTTDAITSVEADSTYVGFAPLSITQQTITADGNAVVKVYYDRNVYTVTWDVDGNTEQTTQFRYQQQITAPVEPEKEGYDFTFWKAEDVLTSSTVMPAHDVTYHANWERNSYTVTWSADGATITPSVFEYQSDVIAPIDPERAGYTFGGWYTDNAFETKVEEFGKMPAHDVTYYGKWIPRTDTTYKVEHYQKAILATDPAVLVKTDECTGTTDEIVTPDTYIYEGFGTPDPQSVKILADGSLVVKYYYPRMSYVLTWQTNNGLLSTEQTRYFEQRIFEPTNRPSKDGYIFDGWCTDAECTSVTTSFGKMPAHDVTYYGKWTPMTYTISYVLNGGSWRTDNVGKTTYTVETADFIIPAVSKTGYTFEGWKDESGNRSQTIEIEQGSMGDRSFEALFSANTYNVVYEGNGATEGAMGQQSFTYDDEAQPLNMNAYKRTGYTFVGWSLYENGTGYRYADGESVSNLISEGTVKLYACWDANEYSLTFDSEGGSDVDTITADYDTAVTWPENPTKKGYLFDGWYELVDGVETVATALEKMPATNKNYYAKWTPITYTVTFNANGGTGEPMENMAFTYDEAQNLNRNTYIREGYAFNGWQLGTAQQFTDMQSVSNLTTEQGAVVELKARWQILSYKLTFVFNNGQSNVETNPIYGSAITAPTTPLYAGYRFDYWMDDTGNETVILSNMPAKDVTYTAHWTSYLDLLLAIPTESFDDAVTNEDEANVLAEARALHALLNDEQKEAYKSDEAYARHYAVFVETIKEVSVIKARAAVLAAEAGTNATLVDAEQGQIATLVVNDELLHVDAILKLPDYPALNMMNVNFLVELFGYDEIKGVVINNSVRCEGTSFTQFEIMLAIAYETFGKDQGYTDSNEFLQYLSNNRNDIYIKELDGYSIEATVLAQTTEGIEYSVDYTLDFFNEYHDVIWVLNNGEEDLRVPTAYQSQIALPTPPTKTGYSFTGWNSKADGSGDAFAEGTLMGKKAVSYYAQWEINQYTLSFDAKGGSEVADITADYGAEYDLPKNPTKTGYTFAGWFDNEACTGTAVELPDTMPAEDVTYYAGWTVNKYTISFNGNGGTVALDATTADYGSSIDEPATDPTRTGYTFTGWYTDSGCTNAVSWPVTMPVNGATYYAGWEANTYKVTLDADGGVLPGDSEVTVTYDEQYGLPAPTRAGYTFLGWFLENGTQIKATDTVNITENIEVKAQWEVGESYDITYELNEGTWAAGTDVPERYNVATNTFTLPAPVRTGYTFLGWTGSNGDTIQKVVTVETGTTGALSYTAHWKINQYTIDFETSGGTAVADITADYQAAVTAPADPTKTGYTFTGWYVDEACTGNPVALPTTMPAEDVTYYAGWDINEYTITFHSNGGSAVRSIVADYQAAITAPTEPIKTGYTFAGWYEDEACTGNPVALPTTMPAEDVTYYAGWSINEYSITFDSNGGSDVDTLYFDYGEAVVAPAVPVRTGYTFAGWDAELPATMPAEDLTYTAKWTVNNYNIVYMVDGATYKTQSIAYGATVTPEAEPTKTGYTFSGWSTIPEKMPAYTVTVTGTFTANTYTVTYDAAYDMAPAVNSNEVTYNSPYGTLPVVERTGYTFAGWFLNGVKVTEETVVKTADNHQLTAAWTANTYRVNLDANGGTCDVAFIDVTYDGTYAALPTPVLEGYDFVGWFDGDAQVLATQTVQITQTQNLVARWNAAGDTPYKVEHYQKGLDGEYDLVLTEELTAATEAKVDATQQSFEGFYFNTQNSTASGEVLADGSLVLKMYYDRESYTVVWELYGEEIAENYLYNQPLVEPDTAKADDIYASYTFTGWNVTLPETVVANATYSAMYDLSYEATIGETTYRTLTIALEKAKAGEMVVLEKDLTLTEDIMIPADVNLLIPCMDDDWGYTMVKAGDEMIGFNHDGTSTAGTTGVGPDAHVYRTLTVPSDVTITVNGALLVNSVSGRPAGGTNEMDVTGGYGQINLDGQIVVNQGGSLDCFGYIKGDGAVTAHSGGSVGDLYIVRNWRGGTQALGMYQSTYEYDGEKKQTYPMNEYDCHNIEADIIIEYGATYDGNVKMNADDGNGNKYYYTKFPQIDVDNGLIRLTDENAYVVRSYDPTTEVETYTIYGGANFAESSLKIITADLSTSTFVYPIDGDIKFVLKDGDYHFVNDWKFLPGEGMTVCSGAALTVDYKVHVAFYDEFIDVDNTGNTEYPVRKPAILTIEEGASFKNAGMFGGSIVTKSPDILIGSQPTWGMTTLEANGYCNSSKKTVEIFHDLFITRDGYTWRYGKPALGELDKSIIWNGANYDALLAALETVPEDLDIYSDETADPLEEVLAEVTYGLGVDKQAVVDGWTADIIKYVAGLALREVTVMFDPSGGTCEVTSISVTYGETFGEASGGTLPVPRYYGFKFLGWYDANNVQITDTVIMKQIVDEITVTAKWEKIPADYTAVNAAIAAIPQDMTGYTEESVQAVYDAEAAVDMTLGLAEQAKVDAMAQAILDAIDNLTYVQITVSFDANGGDAVTTTFTLSYNDLYPYSELPVPTRDGYDFIGWYTAKEGGTEIKADTKVTSVTNVTLYAKWQDNTSDEPADYSNVDAAIAKVPADMAPYTVASVNRLNAAVDAVVYGLTIDRQADVDAWATAIEKAIADLEYKTITVYLDPVDGTCDTGSIKVTYGSAVSQLPTASKEYHKFLGWYTAKVDGNKVTAEELSVMTENLTLYAQYELLPANYSDIDAVKAKIPADLTCYSDASVKKLTDALDAIEPGYTAERQAIVDGWASALQKALDGLEYRTMTMKYDAQGGSVDPTSIVVTYKDVINGLPTPDWDNHVFNGWFTKPVGGEQVTVGWEVLEVNDFSIYAQWTQINADYAKVYEAIDRIPENVELYYTAETVKKLQDALDAVEYGLDAGAQGRVNMWASEINIAIDKLEYVTLKVYFDYNGGTGPKKYIYATCMSSYSNLPTATRTGYNFAGWYTEAVGGEAVTNETVMTAYKEHTLYAHWTGGPADYSAVEAAIARIPSDMTNQIYTQASIDAVNAAVNAVEYGLQIDEQAKINAWADAIIAAIDALEKRECGSDGFVADDCPTEHFKDVDQTSAWYHLDLDYVVEHGIMNGTSTTEFSPEETTTRGMIVTMLYRMSGESVTAADKAACPFVDVDPGYYYADAIAWAYKTGVVNGTSKTTFEPDAEITREQMVTMLHRYADYFGDDVEARGDISSFSDANSVSPYAVEALQWGYAEGLLKGDFETSTGNVLIKPQGAIPRCQAAAFIHRYCEK